MKILSSLNRLERLLYICLIIFSVYNCANALIQSSNFINKPFPGFLLLNNMMISQVSLKSWPVNQDKILSSYDKVLKIDGTNISNAKQAYEIVSNEPVGTQFSLVLMRGNKVLTDNVNSIAFKVRDYIQVFLIQYIVGVIILLTGIILFSLKPELITTKIILLFCISLCNWFVLDFDYQTTYSLSYNLNFSYLFQIFIPAFLINLAFVFPSPSNFFKRNKWIIFLPLAYSLVLFFLQFQYKSDPTMWQQIDTLVWVSIAIATIFITSYLAWNYVKTENILDKQRSLVALIGSAFGFFMPAVLAVIFIIFNYEAIGLLSIPVLIFPVSLSFAIVKHKLFDIDIIFQKIILYVFLTFVVGGFFVLSLLAFNILFSSQFGWNNPVFLLLLSALFVLAINPLRDYIQEFIDETFFRKRYDYASTISELSDAMISILNLDRIASTLTETINHAMLLDSEGLYIVDRESGTFKLYSSMESKSGQVDKHITQLENGNPLIESLYKVKKEIFKEDIESENRFKDQRGRLLQIFTELNASLVFPLFFKDDLRGILVLGRKRSGNMFSSTDIKLLNTLVNQTAIAIENSFSFELVEDYANELERKNQILKNIQEQLIHAEKMSAIGHLASGIAHEIRNPLNIIEGARYYLSSQLENGNSDETVGEYLEYIQNEVIRTNRLIDQLLNFAKLEDGRMENVNINSIVENVLVLSRKQISDAGVIVNKDLKTELPVIIGDSGQLWQVLINVLMNAIQAVKKDGEISIESGLIENYFKSGSDYVYVKVTDNGSGIDSEDLPRIFDPFFTRKSTGTGLGLSVSYKIMESHKGSIVVSSKSGEGAIFIIQLPAEEMKEERLNG